MTSLNTQAEHISVKNQRTPRVLVVDDDRLLRHHARLVLEGMGIEVHEAQSGEHAVDAMRSGVYDTVLLDVKMPGIDGYATCRALRNLPNCESLPIVMATGLNDAQAIEDSFGAGATDFATKPINWMVLKQRIRFLIRAHQSATDLMCSESRREALLHAIPDTIVVMDQSARVISIKQTTSAAGHTELAFSPGRSFIEFLPASMADTARTCIDQLLAGEGPQQFETVLGDDQHSRYFEVRMVKEEQGGLVAILRDVTERRNAEDEVRSLAYFDKVTGLPNKELVRLELDRYLADAADDGSMIAVVRLNLVGLDHAKGVLGSERTEVLMRQLSDRLVDATVNPAQVGDANKTIVGRTHDAGFALVRSDFTEHEQVDGFAHQLLKRIAEPCTLGEYEISLTGAIGAALYPHDDNHGMRLLDKAEMALEHAASQHLAGPCYYSDDLHVRSLKRVQLIRELQTAIENNELHLDYQPKVDARGERLVGVEALVRWHSASRGNVSPAEFIPLAEESGLILPLGEFVLNEACRQARSWMDEGCNAIPIAVNFSGHQFSNRGTVRQLLNTLSGYSLTQNSIEVELTESVAIKNGEQVRHILSELRECGIRTAIDDFGTGYSSLSSLRDFRFHTLKIDRSFVKDLNTCTSANSIVKGIIDMGHALGMQIVAEGVELTDQLALLRDGGCDVIQGYLTGRPTSAQAIQARLVAEAAL